MSNDSHYFGISCSLMLPKKCEECGALHQTDLRGAAGRESKYAMVEIFLGAQGLRKYLDS